MGKSLIAGSALDISFTKDWVGGIAISIGIVFIGFLLAEWFGYTDTGWFTYRNPLYGYILWVSRAVAILNFCYLIYYIKLYGKTNINVYENGIRGVGIGKGDWKEQNFSAGFDRVASVDTSKNIVLTVNLYGRVYTVLAANAIEVAEVVNRRLQSQAAKKNQTD